MAQFQGGKPKGGDPPKKNRVKHYNAPKIVAPRCKVCQSDHRGHVDRLLMSGATVREVAAFLETATGTKISPAAVGRHKTNHLDLHQRALRRIIDARMRGDMDEVDALADDLIDKRTMLEVVVHDGYQRLIGSEVKISLGEWLSAMEKLDSMEREEKSETIAIVRQEMSALTTALKLVLTSDQLDAVYAAFQRNLGGTTDRPLLAEAIEESMIPAEDVEILDE